MKISALNRKLHRAFGGRVTAALADGCIVLRGEHDRWDDVVRAGQMAATKYSTCHVVNDITFTGGKDAPMRVPALHDDALDGQTPDVLVIGGGISAIGGMVYIMTVVGGVWNHEGLSGGGWLAGALVIFCLWSPYRAIWGSILFGGLLILYLRMPIALIPDQIYKILPYVVTVIVLVFTSMRNNRDKQPPASLGLAYFREER